MIITHLMNDQQSLHIRHPNMLANQPMQFAQQYTMAANTQGYVWRRHILGSVEQSRWTTMEAEGSWKDIDRGAELFATLWETYSEVRPPSVAIGRLVLLVRSRISRYTVHDMTLFFDIPVNTNAADMVFPVSTRISVEAFWNSVSKSLPLGSTTANVRCDNLDRRRPSV